MCRSCIPSNSQTQRTQAQSQKRTFYERHRRELQLIPCHFEITDYFVESSQTSNRPTRIGHQLMPPAVASRFHLRRGKFLFSSKRTSMALSAMMQAPLKKSFQPRREERPNII